MKKTLTIVSVCLLLCAASRYLQAQPANLQWQPLKEPSVGGWTVAVAMAPADSQRVVVSGDLLGAAASADGGQNWTQSRLDTGEPFRIWEMNDFTWLAGSASSVWLSTCDGPHFSTDGGLTYSRRAIDAGNHGLTLAGPGTWLYFRYPIQKILIDPANPQRLLAFGGNKRAFIGSKAANYGAIWRSLDGGQTWWQTPAQSESVTVNGGSGNQTRTLLKPWRRLDPVKKASEMNITNAVYAAGSASTTIYVSVYNYGVYKSTTNGDTWSTVNTGLPANARASFIAAHPTDPATLWVVVNGTGIYKTSNGGASWSLSNGTAPNNINIGNGESQDGWLGASNNNGALADPVLYYGSYKLGQVYRSADGGASWTCLVAPIVGNNPGATVAIGGGNGGFDPCCLFVNPANANDVFVAGENILRSDNGGLEYSAGVTSWKDRASYKPEPLDPAPKWRGRGFSGWVSNDFKWNPYAPERAYFMGMDAGKVWVSDNNLLSWRKPAGQLYAYYATNDITFSNDGLTSYIGNGQNYNDADRNDGSAYGQPTRGIAKSTDGGLTYNYIGWPAGLDDGMVRSVYTLPTDSLRLWAIIGRRLYYTANGGGAWTLLSVLNGSGAEDDLFELAAPLGNTAADHYVYVSGRDGIYLSVNGGSFTLLLGLPTATWQRPKNASGACTSITVDPNNREIIYACAFGATTDGSGTAYDYDGLWRFTPDNLATTSTNERRWDRLAGWGLAGTKNIRWIRAVDLRPGLGASTELALITNFDPITDISGATGVWLSADSGATWYQRNQGIGVARGKRIRYSPTGDRLVMGSNGGGFYLAKTDGSTLDYVQTRSADADVYVRDGASSTNFGTTDPGNLLVKKDSSNFNRFAFLRFTVQDVGQTITSAKVRLYGSRAAGTVNPTLSIYPVSDVGWDETAVTFANPPNGVGTTAIGGPTTITTIAQYYEWDVTSYILQQLNAGLVQMSFVIKSNTTVPAEIVTFNSDEAATNKPQLVIRTDW